MCVFAHAYQGATGGKNGFDGGVASSTAAAARGVNPLLFLPAIAEPDPNHLLLHVELVSDHGDLFRGRFLVLLEEGKKARDALWALRRGTTVLCNSVAAKWRLKVGTVLLSLLRSILLTAGMSFSPPESSFLRPLGCWSQYWSSSSVCGWASPCLCPGSPGHWGWTGPGQMSGSLHKQHRQKRQEGR